MLYLLINIIIALHKIHLICFLHLCVLPLLKNYPFCSLFRIPGAEPGFARRVIRESPSARWSRLPYAHAPRAQVRSRRAASHLDPHSQPARFPRFSRFRVAFAASSRRDFFRAISCVIVEWFREWREYRKHRSNSVVIAAKFEARDKNFSTPRSYREVRVVSRDCVCELSSPKN